MTETWTREREIYFVANIFDMDIRFAQNVLYMHPKLLKMSVEGQGYTILHRSIEKNALSIFNTCLTILPKEYLEIKTKDGHSYTPLHLAVIYHRLPMVNKLIKRGVNLDIVDIQGKSPLHWAVLNDNLSLVNILIRGGANINLMDRNGKTPLHLAILYDKLLMVRTLIQSGVDVNLTDRQEKTPLHLAVIYNRPEILKELVQGGADVNLVDMNGEVPLNYAVNNLMVECTAILYHITDSSVRNNIGDDVIFSLLRDLNDEKYIKDKLYRILDMLFEIYDSNNLDSSERNYLYYPVINGYENLTRYLIQKGVNIYNTDLNGMTVIDYAYEKGNQRIISLLEEK